MTQTKKWLIRGKPGGSPEENYRAIRRQLLKFVASDEGISLDRLKLRHISQLVKLEEVFLIFQDLVREGRLIITQQKGENFVRLYTRKVAYPFLGKLVNKKRGIEEDPIARSFYFPVEGYSRRYNGYEVQARIDAIYSEWKGTGEYPKIFLEHEPHPKNLYSVIIRIDNPIEGNPVVGWVPTVISRVVLHHLDQIESVSIYDLATGYKRGKNRESRPLTLIIEAKYNHAPSIPIVTTNPSLRKRINRIIERRSDAKKSDSLSIPTGRDTDSTSETMARASNRRNNYLYNPPSPSRNEY